MTDQQWMELALFAGARDACVMEAREIPFDEKFRSACEENLCGCYNRNWACPPHAGNINTLIERARAYDRALIYITVHDVSNSREEHGFEVALLEHDEIARRLQDGCPPESLLHLSVGACTLCERCTAQDNKPCLYPERMLPSVSAYGVYVAAMSGKCGLRYYNGENTITLFGIVFYHI